MEYGGDTSHRVEAISFAGGIWIGWKNSVRMDVIRNHSLFILTQIWSGSSSTPITVAFVYRSPNRKKHQDLWRNLSLFNPASHTLWVIIRDFNAILSPNKKTKGLSPRKDAPNLVISWK